MAPNPRVVAAFRAMKGIGISEESVKPVLKGLLKLYDKNWEMIEEENYRVLADAIFEAEESKVSKKLKRAEDDEFEDDPDVQSHECTDRRPLKRLFKRNGDSRVSSSPPGNGSEQDSPNRTTTRPRLDSKTEEPDSQKTMEPVTVSPARPTAMELFNPSQPTPIAFDLLPRFNGSQAAISLSRSSPNPNMPPVIVLVPRPKPVHALIVPKDEPFTEDCNHAASEPPVLDANGTAAGLHESRNDDVMQASSNSAAHRDDGDGGILEIASSSSGEVKISLTCHRESGERIDSLMNRFNDAVKMVEGKYKWPEPDFSVKELLRDVCDCVLKPGNERGPGTDAQRKEDAATTTATATATNNNKDGMTAVVVWPDPRPVHDAGDIAKGEERLKVPWVNRVNGEVPPPFLYVSQNLVFCDAGVSFRLAAVDESDCCSSCSGDCLSSPSPCPCGKKCGGFAYASSGLLRGPVLDEHLSAARSSRVFYCRDACPLERWRSHERCRGHVRRDLIKECWSKCGCGKTCGNRTVQRRVSVHLQVFYTCDGRGWGLRTLDDLPRGTFVCEYVGEILTCRELSERGGPCNAYAVVMDACWGRLDRLPDDRALCLDARHYGNVARFINHRCFDANLVDVPLEVESPEHHYYHLAFFTTRDVHALEELTWDYGVDFDDGEHVMSVFCCACGSKHCRNIRRTGKPSSHRGLSD